jgi:glyoxylase-like metal-dependent hydrolase (beta-lactamase superfamily II)
MPDFELVTEHIAKLNLPYQAADLFPVPTAVWLIWGRNGYLLVDSGPAEFSGEMVKAVSRATGGKGPKAVIITHAHPAHVGGLMALRLAWNVPVFCHKQELPYLSGKLSIYDVHSTNPIFWIKKLLMEPVHWGVREARSVRQGETFLGATVLHLPGHTPGHLGLIHKADRAILCGDAVFNLNNRPRVASILTTPDRKSQRKSIANLSEFEFDHLLPSHGAPIMTEGRSVLKASLSRKRRKKSKSIKNNV